MDSIQQKSFLASTLKMEVVPFLESVNGSEQGSDLRNDEW
jgi:hypothetical protein